MRDNRLKVRFLFSFKCRFFRVFLGWMGYVKPFLWSKSEKIQFFFKFHLISWWKRQERANSKLLLSHHYLFQTGKPLAAAPVVVGTGSPYRVPTWLERAKATFIWRKLNDFSIDVRCNCLKLRFLLFFFNTIFSKYSWA